MKKFFFAVIFLFSFLLNTTVWAAPSLERQWRDETIYFILIDRFNNGDESNDYHVDPSDPLAYHGGDFQGIIDRLDYLKNLGFTALWLTPVFDNSDKGYHGYWIRDFYNTEEHFGTIDDLKRLVEEAHKRDMKIILDFVVNHTSPDHPWVTDPEKKNWFHEKKEIFDWKNQEQLENGWIFGLPDLAQENPEVKQYLIDVAKWWITETDIDGYRLDTVKHVPIDFWKDFSKEVKSVKEDFYLLGEVLDYDPNYIHEYFDAGIDGFVDYPLYDRIRTAFSKPGNLSRVIDLLEYNEELYEHPELMGQFIDNHDTPRFTREILQANEKPEIRWKLALTFMYTTPGIPIIYYGTEIALDGGGDPDNRRLMDFEKQSDLTDYISKLGEIRNENRSFTRGDITFLYNSNGMVVYKREYEHETTIVALNNTDQPQELSLSEQDIGKDVVLNELTGNGETIHNQNGSYIFKLDGETSTIYRMEENEREHVSGISFLFIFLAILAVISIFYLFRHKRVIEK
ncbi:alpha-amylase family glycosyl hydrolase [Fervidibacillus halotolerans]|uniref:alpha-amylase n=1 Tax=Fervidibacillus halotolerans TaxID=2980027 RepID=A0A9E8M074_9BACI|nr:alpha-amylase family glycosyl hydrolase [Fervidibacillus halotolerans]WAA13048.1 alpha-amylase family glycosyl hydrolase [Fervidibacillus halotolerans]